MEACNDRAVRRNASARFVSFVGALLAAGAVAAGCGGDGMEADAPGELQAEAALSRPDPNVVAELSFFDAAIETGVFPAAVGAQVGIVTRWRGLSPGSAQQSVLVFDPAGRRYGNWKLTLSPDGAGQAEARQDIALDNKRNAVPVGRWQVEVYLGKTKIPVTGGFFETR